MLLHVAPRVFSDAPPQVPPPPAPQPALARVRRRPNYCLHTVPSEKCWREQQAGSGRAQIPRSCRCWCNTEAVDACFAPKHPAAGPCQRRPGQSLPQREGQRRRVRGNNRAQRHAGSCLIWRAVSTEHQLAQIRATRKCMYHKGGCSGIVPEVNASEGHAHDSPIRRKCGRKLRCCRSIEQLVPIAVDSKTF